ncbi:MAG: helix-turn-helix domain-containing protein [Clostridiales bacterium]|nr:helix-turn-helix domain-containing protein [Clostridiales bacterium]
MREPYDRPEHRWSEWHTEPASDSFDRERTGRKLQLYMEVSGIRPRDIQNYLSLSCVQTVYRWMRGINIPTIDNLYAMSRLFHVRMDDLVGSNPDFFYDREKVEQVERLMAAEGLREKGAA